jgi:hypothetical protein
VTEASLRRYHRQKDLQALILEALADAEWQRDARGQRRQVTVPASFLHRLCALSGLDSVEAAEAMVAAKRGLAAQGRRR